MKYDGDRRRIQRADRRFAISGKTNADAFVSSPLPASSSPRWRTGTTRISTLTSMRFPRHRIPRILGHGFQLQIDALTSRWNDTFRGPAPLCIRQVRGTGRRCHQRRVARRAEGADRLHVCWKLRRTARRRRAVGRNLGCVEADRCGKSCCRWRIRMRTNTLFNAGAAENQARCRRHRHNDELHRAPRHGGRPARSHRDRSTTRDA